jgi:hypothetical protein
MAYSLENIRIIIPVLVDQSELSDGAVVFTWKPAKRINLVSVGFVVEEDWGEENDSKMSLEVDDVELAELTIPASTSLGTEINKSVGIDVQVEAGSKIELIAKDVNAENGTGYFVLEYRELP